MKLHWAWGADEVIEVELGSIVGMSRGLEQTRIFIDDGDRFDVTETPEEILALSKE